MISVSRWRGLAAVTLLAALLVAYAPAPGTSAAVLDEVPKCRAVPGTEWPGRGSLLKDCTGEDASADHVGEVLAALEDLNNVAAGKRLAASKVEVFYFRNRERANDYFRATLPFSGLPGFTTKSAKCGNTVGLSFMALHKIAISVYQNCLLPESIPNPNLGETALHEAGHAFDTALAFAMGERKTSPSQSKGFKAEVAADLANDDKAWMAAGAGQKDPKSAEQRFICNIFSTVTPSAVEIAVNGGAKNLAGSVCVVKNHALTPVDEWKNSSPSAIAAAKMPYFVGTAGFPPYEDLWAQAFALSSGDSGSMPLLPLIDHVLASLFRCAYTVVSDFRSSGQPPATYPEGCPVEPASAYK
jgi:hypothetical protein